MGSYDWHDTLVDRCLAVGWNIRHTSNGHVFVTPRGPDTGGSFTIARSADPRARANSLAVARRAGLEGAELRARQLRDRERGARRATATIGAIETMIGETTVTDVDGSDERGSVNVKVNVAATEGSLGYVDGVAIAERVPAKIETPITRGRAYPMTDGWELLLADGSVVYRCERPAATPRNPQLVGTCNRTFDAVMSLRAHMTFHTRKGMPVAPGERLRREHDKSNERESRPIVAETPPARGRPRTPRTSQTPRVTASPAKRLATIAHNLTVIGANLGRIGSDLLDLSVELENLPGSDVVDKARRWDQMRDQMREIIGGESDPGSA